VQLAVPQPADRLVVLRSFSEPVSDFQTATVSLEVGEARTIADLQVQVDVRHTAVGDLVVSVVPPPAAGAQPVTLHDRTGGLGDDLRHTYDAVEVPELGDLKGKSAQGLWTLEVRDQAHRDAGSIMAFGLEFELA
jgi:subtilisin-like proprotein convertase family protein